MRLSQFRLLTRWVSSKRVSVTHTELISPVFSTIVKTQCWALWTFSKTLCLPTRLQQTLGSNVPSNALTETVAGLGFPWLRAPLKMASNAKNQHSQWNTASMPAGNWSLEFPYSPQNTTGVTQVSVKFNTDQVVFDAPQKTWRVIYVRLSCNFKQGYRSRPSQSW